MPKSFGAVNYVRNKFSPAWLIIATGIVIFMLSGWMWWSQVYLNPERVFWAMASNSLSTSGFSKEIIQDSPSGSFHQTSQVGFGQDNIVRSRIELTQEAPDGGVNEVVTDSIGTLSEDYASYQKIEVAGQNGDDQQAVDSVIGQWGKVDQEDGGGEFFTEAILGNIVPIGNLTLDKRSELLQTMRENGVYGDNLSSVSQTDDNGNTVYVYSLDIQPQAYVSLLRDFVASLGLEEIEGLDPEAYRDAPPSRVEISVNPVNRQLVEVSYPQEGRREIFSSYGVTPDVELPEQTISMRELQARLEEIY